MLNRSPRIRFKLKRHFRSVADRLVRVMTLSRRILRAALGGLFAGAGAVFLTHLLLLVPKALGLPMTRSGVAEERLVTEIAVSAAVVTVLVLLAIRRAFDLRELAAILGATVGVAAVLLVTIGLELAFGPVLPLAWQSPVWLPVMTRAGLVSDAATLSLPAAMLGGAAAGWSMAATASRPEDVSGAKSRLCFLLRRRVG